MLGVCIAVGTWGTWYLEAYVPAPLPHHLQLDRLVVASLPQLQPHAVIDVKQVMGVIPGVAQHFLWQRARVARDIASMTVPGRDNHPSHLCVV